MSNQDDVSKPTGVCVRQCPVTSMIRVTMTAMSTTGKNNFSPSTLSDDFWFELLNGQLDSKTEKMQEILVGYKSNAGSIFVSRKETRQSLDRECEYA